MKNSGYAELQMPKLIESNKKFHYPIEIRRLQSNKKRIWRHLRNDKLNTSIRSEYKLASDAYSDAVRDFHFRLSHLFFLNVMHQRTTNLFGDD